MRFFGTVQRLNANGQGDAYPPKRNGKRRRVEPMVESIRGAMKMSQATSSTSVIRTVRGLTELTLLMMATPERHPLAPTQMALALTAPWTWRATSGNGSQIGMTLSITRTLQRIILKDQLLVNIGACAGVRGISMGSAPSGLGTGTGSSPPLATLITAFVAPAHPNAHIIGLIHAHFWNGGV